MFAQIYILVHAKINMFKATRRTYFKKQVCSTEMLILK
uniref:Uncharacterized protein n=1 Tax=Anguilla anguilla TaxID=7936 RepID=A0A0E9VMC0_ANGAN